MNILTVEVEASIKRPTQEVSRQFGDLRHHERHHVHPGIAINVTGEEGNVCRYTQKVRVAGMMQVDHIVQRREANGDLVSEVVDGTNKGMVFRQTFAPLGDDATTVRIHFDVPMTGIKRLLKPLFGMGVRKATLKALEEDRIDLEQRGYPRPG